MSDGPESLVLVLTGPLQSWGGPSQFNRRDTRSAPSKSGIVGLLAAAQGRRRSESIEDLIPLELGVRIDQAGTLLRDYHTVSDYRDIPLPSVQIGRDGKQKRNGPLTKVTQRYYLQDAVFVAAISGESNLLTDLVQAIKNPVFPLALGRRSCVPAGRILLQNPTGEFLWEGSPLEVLKHQVPWQATKTYRREQMRRKTLRDVKDCPIIVDAAPGDPEYDLIGDQPVSFDPLQRSYETRRVRQEWAKLPTGNLESNVQQHDPFALL